MSRHIEFTESARLRRAQAIEEFSDRLDSYLARKKYVPGETITEITASDIEKAARQMRVSFVDETRIRTGKYLALTVGYIGVGITMVIVTNLFSGLKSGDFQSIISSIGILIASLGGLVGALALMYSWTRSSSLESPQLLEETDTMRDYVSRDELFRELLVLKSELNILHKKQAKRNVNPDESDATD